MPDPTFPDEWLAHSLEGVLSAERLAELRAKATPERTLWETLVAEKIASDEQILSALSTRFRLKLADVSTIDPKVREGVPEQLARRYRVLPLRITDSYLEVATANPFDLDAEQALAFAAARGRIAPDLAHQDHVAARHRGPAPAPGRPRPRVGERATNRPARLDAPRVAGREGRDPGARFARHREVARLAGA